MTLDYRLIVHDGEGTELDLAGLFREFAAEVSG